MTSWDETAPSRVAAPCFAKAGAPEDLRHVRPDSSVLVCEHDDLQAVVELRAS
jgi:hypothetical protein